jgi:hypothetical protein
MALPTVLAVAAPLSTKAQGQNWGLDLSLCTLCWIHRIKKKEEGGKLANFHCWLAAITIVAVLFIPIPQNFLSMLHAARHMD